MDRQRRLASLKDAVRRFGEAWAQGDAATLAAMLSPGYSHTDAAGDLLRRDDWLAYAWGRAGRATQIALHEFDARFVGDVAAVTGVDEVTGPGVRSTEDAAPLRSRFTAVWVWRDGRWLREAFQVTTVAAPGAFA